MLKVIELFAGIGSQIEALKRAEIDTMVLGISEIDDYAIRTYRHLHGWTNNFGVISKIFPGPMPTIEIFPAIYILQKFFI